MPRAERRLRPLNFWFGLLAIGLIALLTFGLAYQTPATFQVTAGQAEQSEYLHNFYPPEGTDNPATAFRWGTTGAGVVLPPLNGSSKITLRLTVIPRPGQRAETPLIVRIDQKEVAQFSLKTDWQDYSFTLDKKLAAPGYLDLELDAPAFQVKGDRRLFTVAFSSVRVESLPGVPPLGNFGAVWLAALAFYVALALQRTRLFLAWRFWPEIGAIGSIVIIAGLIILARPWLSLGWFGVLLGTGLATGISFVLRSIFERDIKSIPADLQDLVVGEKSRAQPPPTEISGDVGKSKAQPQFQSSFLRPRSSVLVPPSSVLFLLLLLAIAALVRLYNLDGSPLGIQPDEAGLGYDSWSVLKTGRDHHGELFPLFFRSFNDYPTGVANYVAIPFIALFGLDVWSVRLPFALLGIGLTGFSYGLAVELFRGVAGVKAARYIGLLAALFVALSPWAISQSRAASLVSTLSFFFVGGFWLMLIALRREAEGKKAGWAWIGSGLMLGTATWTYHTMKLFMALFVVGLLVVYWRLFWQKRRAFVAWAIPFTLVSLPFTIALLVGWKQINYRFSQISVWSDTDPLSGLEIAIGNYFSHFDPFRLFFKLTGDYAPTFSSRPAWIGVVLPALAIPTIVGLIATFGKQWRRRPEIRLVWFWLLIFPLGDALTKDEVPNEVRAMTGIALFEILAAFGCYFIYVKLKQAGQARLLRSVSTAFWLLFGICALLYLHFTLVADPIHKRASYQYGLGETFAEAQKQAAPGAKICVEYLSQGYMQVLFHTKFDPTTYQRLPKEGRLEPNQSYFVKRFDRYEFDCEAPAGLGPGGVAIARQPAPGTTPLWQIFYPDGQVAWWVIK